MQQKHQKKGKIVPKMRFSTGQGRGPQAIMAQMLCSNTEFIRKETLCIWGLDLHILRSQEGSLQDLMEKEERFGKGRPQALSDPALKPHPRVPKPHPRAPESSAPTPSHSFRQRKRSPAPVPAPFEGPSIENSSLLLPDLSDPRIIPELVL